MRRVFPLRRDFAPDEAQGEDTPYARLAEAFGEAQVSAGSFISFNNLKNDILSLESLCTNNNKITAFFILIISAAKV